MVSRHKPGWLWESVYYSWGQWNKKELRVTAATGASAGGAAWLPRNPGLHLNYSGKLLEVSWSVWSFPWDSWESTESLLYILKLSFKNICEILSLHCSKHSYEFLWHSEENSVLAIPPRLLMSRPLPRPVASLPPPLGSGHCGLQVLQSGACAQTVSSALSAPPPHDCL